MAGGMIPTIGRLLGRPGKHMGVAVSLQIRLKGMGCRLLPDAVLEDFSCKRAV